MEKKWLSLIRTIIIIVIFTFFLTYYYKLNFQMVFVILVISICVPILILNIWIHIKQKRKINVKECRRNIMTEKTIKKSLKSIVIEKALNEEFNKQWQKDSILMKYEKEKKDLEKLVNEAKNGLENYQNQIPSWPFLYTESALIKLIGTFEYLMKQIVLNDQITPEKLQCQYFDKTKNDFIKRTFFQNFSNTKDMLINIIGLDIDTVLEPLWQEWFEYFLQIRHILIHNNGNVDQLFINNTSNFIILKIHPYSIGNKFLTEPKHIYTLLKIMDKLFDVIGNNISVDNKTIEEILNMKI
jgi:ABC-type multidrug transport system fused ATPase/permease subunit